MQWAATHVVRWFRAGREEERERGVRGRGSQGQQYMEM
jgi:hypothetical protein